MLVGQFGDLPAGRQDGQLGIDLVELVVEPVEPPGMGVVVGSELGEQLPVAQPSQPAAGGLEPPGDVVELFGEGLPIVGQLCPSSREGTLPGDIGGMEPGVELPPPCRHLDEFGGDGLLGAGPLEPAGEACGLVDVGFGGVVVEVVEVVAVAEVEPVGVAAAG